MIGDRDESDYHWYKMSTSATKRLTNELSEFRKNPPENCSVELVKDNLFSWTATIFGPVGTPYENGIFRLTIDFPNTYPFSAPKVQFKTPILHPNINNGSICLDILKDKWSPVLTVAKVLLSITSLLCEPNPNSALDSKMANLYRTDIETYNRTIKEHTARYSD